MKPINGIQHNFITELDWDDVRHFKPKEFKYPDYLEQKLIFAFDDLRDYVDRKFIVHCDFDFRKGWHSEGFAIDGHFENMHPFDQYEAACRFDDFNGIGFYLWWNNPGIHGDTRPRNKTEHDARWFSPYREKVKGVWKPVYKPITAENLRKYL